jgi:Fur family zinc uptake transcriptional regulator
MTQPHLSCSTRKIEEALTDAQQICNELGVKLTPTRQRVLELLLKSDAPSKAYDLLAEMKTGEAPAKPPTVYRALDFLLENGLAHKIESLNAYVACGHRHHGHAAAFLICDICDSAAELHTEATFQELEKEAKEVKFKPKTAIIEVRGVCASCATAD